MPKLIEKHFSFYGNFAVGDIGCNKHFAQLELKPAVINSVE